MKIVNISRIVQFVEIDMPSGRTETIRVMPKAKPSLPEGATVNPRWLALNPRTITVFAPQTEAVVSEVASYDGDEEEEAIVNTTQED